MKVSFRSEGGFDKTLKWLNKVVATNPTETMHQIGRDGVRSLSTNTPKSTGETASGWNYKITGARRSSEIEWFNTAHPELRVNMAKLIELGHGTGTGGYVAPRPYIKSAMDKVFKNAMDKIAKGLIE